VSPATVHYRAATDDDVAALERIAGADAWQGAGPDARVRRYLAGEHHPQQALALRVVYVADAGEIIGYIAGHLTRRFGCDGELQWLALAPERRGSGVADALFHHLAAWFSAADVHRVCVDVQPGNARARRFYQRMGARELNPHWLQWDDIAVPPGDG
jgi:ribosomal protein S18 acetylase RimI-like enzyme